MAAFKCKMCGGDLIIEQGSTVAECEYCGSKQTLPKLDDDRRANLYDRANHFRRNNEFDKAAGIYEQILNEDTTDAEAYWSLVLCRYGIEYVEDPATHKRVPTVNRTQFTSIFDDDNYRSALQYADDYQRSIYEAEANAINEIQKGILAISQKEEPFDVFICYKETDANGRRTMDSVLANDLYHQLTQEGFKVFFSRITLEDKLGTAYEPYIFAALNSAKVMVALGTKPEYFKAPWVKNEWSRYLALVKQSGGKKVLIPAYRDMDPYDLPEEFSHLQAQDMSKLGFMQDLIRGIKKIAKTDEPAPTVVQQTVVQQTAAAGSIAPLLKRAFMYLEDGEWQNADEYAEKVLDQDPENAEAYVAKLMAELQVRRQEGLSNCAKPFDRSNNFKRAVRFGDKKLKDELNGCITHINERNENARLTGIYNGAVKAMNAANSEAAYKSAAGTFKTIPGFKDADKLAEQCLDKAEVCRKDTIYSAAVSQMSGDEISKYKSAIKSFQSIPGWKDSDERVNACQREIEVLKAKAEADRIEKERQAEEDRIKREQAAEQARIEAEKRKEKAKRIAKIVTPIVAACLAFVVLLITVIIPNAKYNSAVKLFESGDYHAALSAFEAMNGYKDSDEQIKKCKRGIALELTESGDYDAAYALLKEIGDDETIRESKYDRAMKMLNSGNYEAAYALLEEIGNNDVIASSKYDRAMALLDSGDYDTAYALLEEIGQNDAITSSKFDRAMALLDSGDYEAAYALLDEIGENDAIASSKYDRAMALIDSGDYEAAYLLLNGLNYRDSADKLESIKPQYKQLLLSKAQAGSYILFGSYEQDNNTANGKEDIEWKVLAREGDRLLVISKFPLDSKPYNTSDTSVTWETCSLRAWLNGTFINNAFSADEQAMIRRTTVTADKNPRYGTSPGDNTIDRVFLLSIKEVTSFFPAKTDRQCRATVYAKAQSGYISSWNFSVWWLRSPGIATFDAAVVIADGSVDHEGYSVESCVGVRPAMWINVAP